MFRVGLNYRIGGNTRSSRSWPANWAGFYLGGNFGSGTVTGSQRSPTLPQCNGYLRRFNRALDRN